MYSPIKNGSSEILELDKGELLEVYLPPQPPRHEIQGYDLPKKKQKWQREDYPDWWKDAIEEEEENQEEDPDYRDPRCEAFRKEHWHRRLNGFWFMNNGKPIYLTGAHWYTLNWCKLDVGYPLYYDFQRKSFYFSQWCSENPTCLGYFKVGQRGFGKTIEEICLTLESMTRPPHRRVGALQSKSGTDAKRIFSKMVDIYNELPEFFKPESNHGSHPEAKFSWFRDTVKGKKAKKTKRTDDDELKNTFFWAVSKETALDGETMSDIIQEEIGKADPKEQVDVDKRIQVNRFVVFRRGIKYGMLRCTSTIEEMKAGGTEAKKVWNKSDSRNLTENGFTISSLMRSFRSALDTTVLDEYGMSDQEAARKIHDAERRARKDDPNELSSYIRKNPYSSDEAFAADGESCEFNAYILNKRLQELELKEAVTVGNFDWTSGRDSKVAFFPDPKGKWRVAWLPENEEESNLVEAGPIVHQADGENLQTWRPMNDLKFRMGEDPVELGINTVDKRVSDTAFYVYKMFDMSVDTDPNLKFTEETCRGFDYKIGKPRWKTNIPIVEYIARNDDPMDSFEDTIKTMRFFGCSVLPETNKASIKNHLITRGYGDFIKYRPKETWTTDSGSQNTMGMNSVEPVIQQYLIMIKSYVNNYGHLIPFKALVKDLLEFRRSKIREHDACVAFGFTLMATLGEAKTPPPIIDVTSLFNTYRINGSQTTLSR